jgi:hypothetical protein
MLHRQPVTSKGIARVMRKDLCEHCDFVHGFFQFTSLRQMKRARVPRGFAFIGAIVQT